MKVRGNVYTEVEVQPLSVIEGLIEEFLGDKYHNWIKSEDGKHWLINTRSVYHNSTEDNVVRELTKEDVEYFNALKITEKYLLHNLKNDRENS